MTVTLASFVNARRGTVVKELGWLGGQCTDLAAQWARLAWGKLAPHANAIDWRAWGGQGVTWTHNGPVNYPPPGALVVWDSSVAHAIGTYGHIALCITADPESLLTLDQNWPPGAVVDIISHDYGGVAGWLTPTPK